VIATFSSRNPATFGVLLALITLQFAGSVSAQSLDAMRDRFREQCRAKVIEEQGRNPGNRSRVAACVLGKMESAIRASRHETANAPTPTGEGLRLFEFTPLLAQPHKGPAEAKGVVYMLGGYFLNDRLLDNYRLGPYFLKSLSEDGWDVIFAKLPQSVVGVEGIETLGQAARTMERRATEFRAEGYKRVIVGGHSWGAWVALVAGRDGVAADALLVSAPATFGPNISPTTHKPNSSFRMNLTEFGPATDKVKMPTVLIIPDDNIWDPDPAARGEIAEKHFMQANVPHFVIAKPPGFYGHFTSWLPFFDFAYGKCIDAFLETPKTQACTLPLIAKDDFRSILRIKQVADADKKRIISPEMLMGKKFAVYENNDINRQYDFISTGQRINILPNKDEHETFAFRDGLLCAASKCSTLIRWSEREILEFDGKTGDLKAWWIAEQ
jgi:pimeloyl-ACP methyl ester carboxylesterase